MHANSHICMIVYSANAVQIAHNSASGWNQPAPTAYAAVHLYATPALSSVMLCYQACNKQHI